MTSTSFDPRRIRGPLGDLARFGGRPALLDGDTVLSFTDLAGLVAARAEVLGAVRRLVMLECANDVSTVVTYLAALSHGHPVLLTGRHTDVTELESRYRPDVLASGDALEERVAGTRHDLHPDLALLLSTSGSTGSPKLVRLSADNVRANAESIGSYLGLSAGERAATTLPMHYCYGLSVLNSHLLAGGSLLLTERSVVEPQFWHDFGRVRATSFAGVPHTFDLLDSSGFAERDLPTLRYITQAGGRLEPARVERYARLGRTRGFDLVVMYGQTEATARMAWLPPHLAERRPQAIGIPVPGGDFRIDCVDDAAPGSTGRAGADAASVGELVYTGPNVMLGYAARPADLALGRVVDELRTGDLARQHEDGIYEIVGRLSRFAKVFGLRVDLDDLERGLTTHAGSPVRAVEDDGRVTLFVTRHLDVATVRAEALRRGLPAQATHAYVVDALPRTPNGKTDYAALAHHAAVLRHSAAISACDVAAGPGGVSARMVRDLYAELLGRPDATPDDSFVSLRGDSLSFVEVSIRLGDLLGALPTGWPQLSAEQLSARARHQRTPAEPRDPGDGAGTPSGSDCRPVGRRGRWFGWRRMETPLLLRAAAIVLVVASHANLISVAGGAHVLLAIAGVSLARFHLSDQPPAERRRSLLRAAREIAIPSGLWIAAAGLVTGMYSVSTATLTNNLLGSDTWDVRWQFWFLEVVVWSLVGAAALVSLPVFDRLERRQPYWCAAALVSVTVVLRYVLVGLEAGPTERYALPVVLWCVALGWMAARSQTATQRVLTVVAAAAATYGFFDDVVRETLIVGGVALAACLPTVPVPRVLARLIGMLAASSLFVYLTHWQVYPHLEDDHPVLATVSSFVVGAAVWKGYTSIRTLLRRHTVTSRSRVEVSGAGDLRADRGSRRRGRCRCAH